MFTIYNDSGSDSTMVSNLFIDEYMKSANDAQIKVYLYLLRMMGTHRAASVSDMADQFNHTEKDVVRSLRYWEKKGLLNLDFDSRNTLISIRLCRPEAIQSSTSGSSAAADANRVLAFSKSAGNLLADPVMEDPRLRMAAGGVYPAQASVSAGSLSESFPEISSCSNGKTAEGSIPAVSAASSAGTAGNVSVGGRAASASSPSELEALESFRSSGDRAQLLFVIEQYIGKPLSLNEIRIIYHISENLHFSDDMIDYLLQYCVDRGKKDFRYIKKVAENWAQSGILTPMQAEQAAAQEPACSGKKKTRTSKSGSAPADTQSPAAADAPLSANGSSASRPAGKRQGRTGRQTRSANSFNQFEQNDYDFDALEKELLQS